MSPAIVLAHATDAADIVVAGIQLLQEFRDFLGWILRVGIQRDHVFAADMRKTGGNGRMLTRVRP